MSKNAKKWLWEKNRFVLILSWIVWIDRRNECRDTSLLKVELNKNSLHFSNFGFFKDISIDLVSCRIVLYWVEKNTCEYIVNTCIVTWQENTSTNKRYNLHNFGLYLQNDIGNSMTDMIKLRNAVCAIYGSM